MIQVLTESKDNVIILQANSQLTDRDYKEVFIPRLKHIINNYGKARLLLNMNGYNWEMSALWDDTYFGLAHKNSFEKMGVIGGSKWVDWGMKLVSLVISGEIRHFKPEEKEEAMKWIFE
jgi:hypothetical protein